MDSRASAEFGIPVRTLMENAGAAIFQEIKRLIPDGGRLTFACGKGNNGGDGFAAAALAVEAGYQCECLAACEEPDLAGEPRFQFERAQDAGARVIFANEPKYQRRMECLGCRDLVIDALVGTGARCALQGRVLEAVQSINRSGIPVLSVDVPSGICADTGEELGESIWALRTVTFGVPKPFLFQGTGLEHTGSWRVDTIGFPKSLLCEPGQARLIDDVWVANVLPARLKASHKGDNGHVLIVAGSDSYPGAAAMCAKAAIRSGAGLVTVAAIPKVCDIVAHHVPEAIYLRLPEQNGNIGPGASKILLENQTRFQAAAFGPGLTTQPEVLEVLTEVWSQWTLPTVIDADALNALAKGIPAPKCDFVLTPHPGEMSRLIESSVAEIQCDRFAAVEAAAKKFGGTALLKGPHSMVSQAGQTTLVNSTGNPGMASAGMGDTLTGIVLTLLGQAVPGYYAAGCGMFWHGLAADICAEEIGAVGFTATDVANAIPMARAKIVASCNYESCSC